MYAKLRNFDFLKRIIGMILKNNRKAFQEMRNRIIGKILSIIASSLLKRRKRPRSTQKPRLRKKGWRKTLEPHKCKDCGNILWSTLGHTQFWGKWYCSHAPGQIPKDEWLALRRKEAGITPAPSNIPRNSLWRKKQRGEPRKYTCRQCGERMNTAMSSTGHIRWGGRIYCPNIPGQISAEEWVDQRRRENVSPDTETEDEEEIEEDAEDKDGNEDEDEDDKTEEEKEGEEEEEEERQRKVYTCRICNMPMRDTGHTHFREQ